MLNEMAFQIQTALHRVENARWRKAALKWLKLSVQINLNEIKILMCDDTALTYQSDRVVQNVRFKNNGLIRI